MDGLLLLRVGDTVINMANVTRMLVKDDAVEIMFVDKDLVAFSGQEATALRDWILIKGVVSYCENSGGYWE
jgi:hypothetical protein